MSVKNFSKKNTIQSQFLRFRFIIFIFVVLIFSITLISPNWTEGLGMKLLTDIILATLISVINFFLGYHIIKFLFLKEKFFFYKILAFIFLAYLAVPFAALYITKSAWSGEILSLRMLGLTFGITFLANTLLLLFYYTNTQLVVFEEDSNMPNTDSSEIGGQIFFFLRNNRTLSRIRFDETIYLEVDGSTLLIQTVRQFYETRSTLREIIKRLPDDFIQVNKSVVINISFFEQLIFENETKRSKIKVVYQQKGVDQEEIFYIGRKFLAPLKNLLSK